MNRHVIGIIAACALVRAVSQAQNQTLTSVSGFQPGDRNVVDSTGTATNGLTVQIGYFDTAGGFSVSNAPQGTAPDLVNLHNHWNLFAGTTTASAFGRDGTFQFSVNSLNPPTGQQIDLWVFKTIGNAAPLPDFSNVLEYGLFTGPNNIGQDSWVFPSPNVPPFTTTATTAQVDKFFWGSSIGSSPSDPVFSLQLATLVPEPSSTAILGLGLALVGFVTRLRR